MGSFKKISLSFSIGRLCSLASNAHALFAQSIAIHKVYICICCILSQSVHFSRKFEIRTSPPFFRSSPLHISKNGLPYDQMGNGKYALLTIEYQYRDYSFRSQFIPHQYLLYNLQMLNNNIVTYLYYCHIHC